MAITIEITPTRVVLDDAKFDTDFRYLREVTTGELSTLLAGPSLAVSHTTSTANDSLSWRFTCGSYSILAPGNGTTAGAVSNSPTKFAL